MVTVPTNLLQKREDIFDCHLEGSAKKIFLLANGKYVMKQFKKSENHIIPTIQDISNSVIINAKYYPNIPETRVCHHQDEIVIFQEYIKGVLLKDIAPENYSKELIKSMKSVLYSSQKALLHGCVADVRGTQGVDYRTKKRTITEKFKNMYENYDICDSTNFIFDGEKSYFVDCESVSTLEQRNSIYTKTKFIILNILYYLIIQIHLYALDEKLKQV